MGFKKGEGSGYNGCLLHKEKGETHIHGYEKSAYREPVRTKEKKNGAILFTGRGVHGGWLLQLAV